MLLCGISVTRQGNFFLLTSRERKEMWLLSGQMFIADLM